MAFVGLTGGIGSGKSTVGRLLAARGVPVLDADQLAREVVAPGQPAHAAIAAAWPTVVGPDGHLDRRALGAIVFADAAARARLEALTHPRIQERALAAAHELAHAGHRLAFYEASLLVETGRTGDFDGLVVVTAPEDVQVARVMARDGRSEAEARDRIRAQLPLADKVRVATDVIDNGGALADTERQVDALLARLRARYAAG